MSIIKLLDGAMGSELIKRGEALQPYIWSASTNLNNPELVYQIHKDYVRAGAQYIITNTFRTTPRAYKKTRISKQSAEEKAYLSFLSAIQMAQRAASERVQVLGSIAPLEDCYMPELFPGKEAALKEFTQLGRWMKDAGVDAIILETMNNIIETQSALNVLSCLNLPIWVSFYLVDAQNIASGESFVNAISLLSDYPVECLLINCSTLDITLGAVDNIVENWNKCWGVYPNLGIGNPSSDGAINKIHSNDKFISIIKRATNAGATIIGGCCGSTPLHISLLKDVFILNF